MRCLAAVRQRGGFDLEAIGALLYGEQRDAVGFARASGSPGGNQDDIGAVAVDDKLLGAVKQEAVALASGLHRDTRGVVMLALVNRQRCDRFAGENAGEPSLRLG